MKLSHAETQALISSRLDGPLDPVAERELNAHLATCDSCRAFNASTVRLARGLQSLPYLPPSPAVTRAVLDHVRAPRSPLSWLSGSFPANALPAASAIAAAVIVVFVGSFAAFQFLDEGDDRSTIPAATTITELAQGARQTSESTDAEQPTTESVEAQIFATEVDETPSEPTAPSAQPTEPSGATTGTDAGGSEAPTEIGPQGGVDGGQSATEAPLAEASEAPAVTEAASEPTVEPTTEAQANESAQRIRNLLGLGTAEPTSEPTVEPTEEPTSEPTPEPTQEPTAAPTLEPTPEPTEEPTAVPTTEPTDEPTPEPTHEPTVEPTAEPTEEAEDDLPIVGPAGDAITRPTDEPAAEPTLEPTEEPTVEPTLEPTEAPTQEPTEEPTLEPTEEPTLEPTEEPTLEPTDEPIVEPTATVVPIVQRDEDPVEETPGGDQNDDDNGGLDGRDLPESDEPEDAIGPSGDAGDSGDDDGGDATPDGVDSEQGIESDDGSDEPIIEPTDGNDDGGSGDGNEASGGDDGNGDDGDQGDPSGEGDSLADADIYLDIQDVPSEGQDPRLGLSAGGDLVFSPNPGRVSLEQNGVTLDTGQGPAGQVVLACAGDCFDISSASQSDGGGGTDTPIGWLDGQVIYERLNGDDFAVEFRVITLDDDLQPIQDDLIGGGGEEYVTNIRPYFVDGALLAPSAGGWVRISTAQVEIFGFSQFGSDISQIRLYESAGQIAYVTGGSLILATISSPGSPILQVSYPGSDYDFSPDGSRIAVVTGSGIDILDASGNLLTTYDAGGIAIGSLSWLNDGLVFVDLDGGVLRIIEP